MRAHRRRTFKVSNHIKYDTFSLHSDQATKHIRSYHILSIMSSHFEETFKQAVSPGSERLLSGVALAAAGSDSQGKIILFVISLVDMMYAPFKSF
jgi:hypothetical protein